MASIFGALPLRLLTLGEASCHFMGSLLVPGPRNQGPGLQAAAKCVRLPGNRSLGAVRDCSLMRDPELDHSAK